MAAPAAGTTPYPAPLVFARPVDIASKTRAPASRRSAVAKDCRGGRRSGFGDGPFEGDYNELASAGGYTYIARCQGQPAFAGEPAPLVPNPDARTRWS